MATKPLDRPLLRHQMLLEESDRGCVLIAVAALDESMSILLRACFSNVDLVVKQAVEPLFGPSGPLSSFWTKILLCYSLGLLPNELFTDLEKVRKLRNRFAHVHEPRSFDMPAIAAVVSTLSTSLPTAS
jgi:DNA-binding MltR family transcriptional regulator